VYVCLFC